MNKQAHNYIFEYHDAITSGRIRAGKWIKAIYKILVEGIKNGEWVFDQKKANKAIKFIENYCHHSEGRNDLLKLDRFRDLRYSGQKHRVPAIQGSFSGGCKKERQNPIRRRDHGIHGIYRRRIRRETVLSGPEIGTGRSCIRRILSDCAAGRRTFRD